MPTTSMFLPVFFHLCFDVKLDAEQNQELRLKVLDVSDCVQSKHANCSEQRSSAVMFAYGAEKKSPLTSFTLLLSLELL